MFSNITLTASIAAIALAAAAVAAYVAARRISRAFAAKIAERERALKELRTLADDIAHDLRTPLTHLAAMAEMAATDQESLERLPGNVADECAAMLTLVNTMLDISKTGFSIGNTPREKVDLKDVARRTDGLFRMVAAEKSVSLALLLPEEDVFFMGHRAKLMQLIGNLVDNAVKFTSRGGEVSLMVGGAPSGGVDITVRDTGCGIAKEDMPFIFDRFWRAESSRSRRGNGLGLSLVKAITDSYGGTISAEPTPRGGTTFKVHLPPPSAAVEAR